MKVKHIPYFIILGLLTYIIAFHILSRETKQELKAERDSLLNEAKHLQAQQEISSTRIYELEEQIAIQDQVLQNRELEAIRAKEGEAAMRKKYESEKFKNYTSEERLAEFRKLYPSFK